MAGHSQFKNIMHRKGRQDKARAKLFSKLGREITTAAKMGMPDPNFNPRLRLAIIAARAENMPKDNIERAIKKSQGGDTENYDEVRYEGYGPGGVAVIVEALTDNRNRTAGEVRSSFTKSGGNLAETDAVSFMFDRLGVIEFDAKVASGDAMLDAAIEAGADDVASDENGHTDLCLAGFLLRSRQGAGSEIRRAAQGGADLEAAEQSRGRRRAGREAPAPDRGAGGKRRRAECLRQFRGVGRARVEDERIAFSLDRFAECDDLYRSQRSNSGMPTIADRMMVA